MDNLLPLIFYSLPYVLAMLAAALMVAIGGVGLSRPWLLMLPFLTALFWLSENRFGRIDAGGGPTLLSRGAGVMMFPAFLWGILLVLTWARVGRLFRRAPIPVPRQPLTLWFLAWTLLLLAHVAVALVIDIPLKQSLSPGGFAYVAWLGVLVAAMVATFERPADARRLAMFFLGMGMARALFGLVRFAAFGGDPVNAYANRQGLALKLTFFDINDSLLCALTLSIALVMLYRAAPPGGWRTWQRVALWLAVVVPALCIVLSFRRTAWVGMVLAVGFVLLQLPSRARWRFLLLASPVMLSGISYAAWKRLSQVRGPSSGFLYDLMPRAFGAESSRLLELKLAWRTLMDTPFFGVGSWGGYKGWQQISWQVESADGGAGTFLHSGILHLALKTGLVGLVLLVGTSVAFILAWRRLRRTLPAAALPLAVAGVAGVLFNLPDWLLGTPVPQIRTMALLGICMSLPFVAERCFSAASSSAETEPTARQRLRALRPQPEATLATSWGRQWQR